MQEDHFKQISIIHYALLGGQFMFAIVMLYLVNSGQAATIDGDDGIFTIGVPLVLVISIFGALYLNRTMAEKRRSISNVNEKIGKYRLACILQWALLEGANLFALIAILMTGNLFYFIFFVIGMAMFYLLRPIREDMY